MKSIKNIVLTAAVSSVILGSLASAEVSQSVTYENQRGSTMVLTFMAGQQDNTGTLAGTFTSAVGSCAKDVGVSMPLTGYYNGNAIALSVNFPDCQVVIAMTGNLLEDQNQIKMMFLGASPAKDPSGKDWNSNVVGTDFYNKVNH